MRQAPSEESWEPEYASYDTLISTTFFTFYFNIISCNDTVFSHDHCSLHMFVTNDHACGVKYYCLSSYGSFSSLVDTTLALVLAVDFLAGNRELLGAGIGAARDRPSTRQGNLFQFISNEGGWMGKGRK